ncbi:MAG: EVE domain-containing protein [Gammaproteobacteria bacterium]|nr:EVE domain-containing protein [Gammaproteobacteria bacterium]MCI0590491.1 EVE domain-containing protein [Gammaproteobacteria bacterium]
MHFWLMKSEPSKFSIDDLMRRAGQTEPWDGVRNYQARNLIRDEIKVGDLAFFYHSNCEQPAIVGIMEIVREGYPDHTAFDPNNKHYDPKSKPEMPSWYRVDVRFRRKLTRAVTLAQLRMYPEIANVPLLRHGNRLSVIPISIAEWDFILGLERAAIGDPSGGS